jgi:O-antigen/teichoic acid export membrane protein
MLLRQTLLYLPAQVLGPVFQFVSILAWTHFLLPREFGVLALITAVQELSLAATLMWFTHYTIRHAGAPGGHGGRFLDTESFVLALSGAATLVILLAMPALVEASWTVGLMAAASAQSLGRLVVAQLSERARASGDTLSYSILQVGWPVGGFILALTFLMAFGPGATQILSGYALAEVLSVAAVLRRLGLGTRPAAYAQDLMAKAMAYALPLVIGGLLVWLANNGLRFVLEWRDGAAAVGLVSAGWNIGLRIASVAAMMVTAAGFPLAMRRAREHGVAEGQAQLARNGVLLLAALAPACAGLWMITEQAVPLVIGEAYQAVTAAILPASILAGAARSFRIHCGEQVFLLHERTMVSLINDAIDAAGAMIGGAIGLWTAGLEGLIAGSALGSVLSLAVTLAWGWALYRFAIPLGDVVRILLATGAMVLVVALLPRSATLVSVTATVAIGALMFGGAMALLYPGERAKLRAIAQGFASRAR